VKTSRPPDPAKDCASWDVEVMIPFADLNQTIPKPGAVWRANLFRINHGTNHPVEASSWSPTQSPQFHHPNRFGNLEFGE
jgi:hypothetical protein